LYLLYVLKCRFDYFGIPCKFSVHIPPSPTSFIRSGIGDVARIKLMNVLSHLLEESRLLNWIRSVLAYSEQSVDPSVDSHLHALSSAFENVSIWMECNKIQIKAQNKSITFEVDNEVPSSTQIDLFRWDSKAAAIAWLTGNPKHKEASMAAFVIAETLAVPRDITSIHEESNVHNQFPKINALRSAENNYRTAIALGGSNESEMFTLSATLSTTFARTGSINDINAAIVCGEAFLAMKIVDETVLGQFEYCPLAEGDGYRIVGRFGEMN